MTLFTKKEKIILNSELQRDNMIERLDRAHVAYEVKEDKKSGFSVQLYY